jgi:hypothetical protein
MAGKVTGGERPFASSRQLDSWKEIAAYLGRDVRTVQRWERREGLPVHRLQHSRLGSVFAHTAELDAWRDARDPAHHDTSDSARRRRGAIQRRVWVMVAGFAGVITVAIGLGRVADRGRRSEIPR